MILSKDVIWFTFFKFYIHELYSKRINEFKFFIKKTIQELRRGSLNNKTPHIRHGIYKLTESDIVNTKYPTTF